MKLLVLANKYNTFVKGLVDAEAKYVDEINVLVHHYSWSEILKYFPTPKSLDWVKRSTRDSLIDLRNKPKNVNVHVVSTFLFPPSKDMVMSKILEKLFIQKIERYINKHKLNFDLIHAHFTWPYGYVAVKLKDIFDVPVVLTIHRDRDWFLNKYHSKDQKIYYVWKKADALIRVNKADVPLLMKLNKNVFFIPNGFSRNRIKFVDKNEARKSLGVPETKKIIFTMGNLEERKGFQYLIEAMSEIVDKRKDVLCYIGGKGYMKQQLERSIKKYNLEEYVNLLGFIPEDKLSLWLNAADLFVLPSLSESFGVVQIEAMSVGVPVVATINGGSEGIISSEDFGLLCAPKDANCLAIKILDALNRGWDREKIIKYAEQFAWKNIAKQTVEVYNAILTNE